MQNTVAGTFHELIHGNWTAPISIAMVWCGFQLTYKVKFWQRQFLVLLILSVLTGQGGVPVSQNQWLCDDKLT